MSKKIKIKEISNTRCEIIRDGKVMKLKGNEAIITMSLARNSKYSISEKLLMVAIVKKRPLPKMNEETIKYFN